MRFGPVPVEEAVGAISAHTIRAGDLAIRKGSAIAADSVARLRQAGIDTVVAVRLDPDDVGEDAAALDLARAIAGEGTRVEPPFTGRSNLYATGPGILRIDRPRIDSMNAVDEAVTVATLPAFKPVVAGEMVATVKIIPYAVPEGVLAAALAGARGRSAALSVASYRRHRVGVVSTRAGGLKPSVIAKTLANLEARLLPAGAAIAAHSETAHDTLALAEELRRLAAAETDLIVVFGASAIADRRDVIPAALEAAGGTIEHFGMPVDPGNLMLVGSLAGRPVIGAPGCARSPKENGFDWVLQRLLADIPVTRADITGMGVGGLLMEIVSRGQPRGGGEPGDED